MENVVREDLDQLNAVLTVQVPITVYKPLFENKLKDFKRKAQIKGFRKGHTPEGFVRKMYGQSILAEVVQEEINKSLQAYLLEHKPVFFGEPILSADQPPLDFDPSNPNDYQVKFELGLVPEFDLQGMDQSNILPLPQVILSDADIEEQVEALRRRHGERVDITEGSVQLMDYVELHLEEYEEGRKKEGGVHTHSHFLVGDLMTPYLQDQLLGKSLKDTFVFDPHLAEKNSTDRTVRKYILHLDENAPDPSHEFFARIDKITRVTPAPLDEEFFKKAFGPNATLDESSMRELLKDNILDSFEQQTEDYSMAHMKISLLAANPIPLPEGFLRRWVVNSDLAEKDPEEWTEDKFRRFFSDLRWTLIRDKIIEKYDIQVTNTDVITAYKHKLTAYFGGNPDPVLMEALAPRILEDKEMLGKITDQVFNDKLTQVFKNQVHIQREQLGPDMYKNWIESAFDRLNEQFNSL